MTTQLTRLGHPYNPIRSTSDAYLLEHYGYDKEPWENVNGIRSAIRGSAYGWTFDPRPSCIPSPDPLSWIRPWDYVNPVERKSVRVFTFQMFKPRRWGEFEPDPNFTRTETNPILSAFRESGASDIQEWLDSDLEWLAAGCTPEQVESARRVLTKLRDVLEASK